MMSAKTTSKYDCKPFLFSPETPENRSEVKALFCGRQRELQNGLTTLRKHLDICGKQSRKYDKRPWVIHGESRSGKSHLARRILVDLPKNKKRFQIWISARERMEAGRVMQELFEHLWGEFCWRIADQTLTHDPLLNPQVRSVHQVAERMRNFLAGQMEDTTVTLEESTKRGAEAGLEVGPGPRLFKFLAKFRAESTEKQAIQYKVRNPTPRDMGQLCGIMAETLVRFNVADHVLLLADDVDLLESYMDTQRNARRQRSILSDALIEFQATPGVDVLVTSRSWYAHAQKEFQTLVDLAMSPEMSPEELTAIHDRRYARYGVRRAPSAFLSREALARAAQASNGLPGVFLQHLDTAFRVYRDEPDWGERGYSWFLDIFQRRFENLRAKCPQAADAIEGAVRDSTLNVDVTKHNPFFGTMLDNEFVFQSYEAETTYFLPKLVFEILPSLLSSRSQQAEGPSVP